MSSAGELFITEVVRDSIKEEDLKKIEEKVKEVGGAEWDLVVPQQMFDIWDKVDIPATGSTNIVVYERVEEGVVREKGIIGKVFWRIPKSQYYEASQDYYFEFEPRVKVKLFKKMIK
jgi:hypothetical protein